MGFLGGRSGGRGGGSEGCEGGSEGGRGASSCWVARVSCPAEVREVTPLSSSAGVSCGAWSSPGVVVVVVGEVVGASSGAGLTGGREGELHGVPSG